VPSVTARGIINLSALAVLKAHGLLGKAGQDVPLQSAAAAS